MKSPLPLLVLLCVCFAAPWASAQTTCRKCDGSGLTYCPDHKEERAHLEEGARYCSVAEHCEEGCVDGWVDCKRCDNPDADKRLADRRAEIDQWARLFQPYHDEMGRRLRLARGDNVLLVWEIDSMKINKRRKDGHELLHLYLNRIEQLYSDYVELMGAKPEEFKTPPRVFVWWTESDQLKASLRYCSQSAKQGMKLMGADASYSVCGNRQYYISDDQLHRNIVHSVTHLLVSHQAPSQWLGNVKGGWVDEGLPHYFEEKYFGICDNYCYEEANTAVGFKGGKYKVALRKMIAAGKSPPVAPVLQSNSDQLSPEQHAVAFSLVDYLIQIDAAKFNDLCKRLRAREVTREVLKDVYGLSPLTLESHWKQWVLETYPTR